MLAGVARSTPNPTNQLGHATAGITLDTYGHLFPSEMEALADRLEQARAAALANRTRTPRGPLGRTRRKCW
jgi:hypothetical protein